LRITLIYYALSNYKNIKICNKAHQLFNQEKLYIKIIESNKRIYAEKFFNWLHKELNSKVHVSYMNLS